MEFLEPVIEITKIEICDIITTSSECPDDLGWA